jgi:hypothetical protein
MSATPDAASNKSDQLELISVGTDAVAGMMAFLAILSLLEAYFPIVQSRATALTLVMGAFYAAGAGAVHRVSSFIAGKVQS